MDGILALLVLSALAGLLLGLYFSWIEIVLAEPILAVLSAVVLQHTGFDVVPGTATIVACLTVSQIAYLAGVKLLAHGRENKMSRPHGQPDKKPGKTGQNPISHNCEREHEQNAHMAGWRNFNELFEFQADGRLFCFSDRAH
jgi:hypothetical protein